MVVRLVNPNYLAFGVGVITPRWLFVLAGATPSTYGVPHLVDETLAPFDPGQIAAGDVVGISIHTGNALQGYDVGRRSREHGAWVVYGGIHATLYPDEASEFGGAHAVVKGDGDQAWATVLADCARGTPAPIYDGGRVGADRFVRRDGTCCRPAATCGRRCRR